MAVISYLTPSQTGQGLLAYLQQQEPDLCKKVSFKCLIVCLHLCQGIVLGYDGRHNSSRWARLTAGIFLKAKVLLLLPPPRYPAPQVPVILFPTTVPTPFIPFTVLRRGAAAGVMVTASHNPK